MIVKLKNIKPGDWVMAWVMTSNETNAPIQGQVVRVNRKTVSVIWEHSGRFQRVDPYNLTDHSKGTPFWD